MEDALASKHTCNMAGIVNGAYPSASPSSSSPFSFSTAGSTPKKGRVAEPGLRAVAPGKGVIRCDPVSVCHQVSTIGHLLSPTTCTEEAMNRLHTRRLQSSADQCKHNLCYCDAQLGHRKYKFSTMLCNVMVPPYHNKTQNTNVLCCKTQFGTAALCTA